MALNNLGMGIVFTARDQASQVIRGLGNNFLGLDSTVGGVSDRMAEKLGVTTDVMNSSLKRLAGGLAVATIGLLGFSTAANLAAKSEKFEEGLAGVAAITRATTAELRLLEGAAIDAGVATQFSPTEAIEGLQSLGAAGQTAKQATATLIPVLDLAAASLGQLGVAGSAEALVGTLNAYSLGAEKAANVTDRLVKITQISNFQARDFASGLSTAAVAGATFNQSLDTVLVTMGLLRNANIDASRAATSFREATTRLGSDQRAQQAIAKFGVKVFDDQTGKMRSLITITRDFAKATKNLSDEEKLRTVKLAFGQRGLLAFSAISSATSEKIAELAGELRNAGGAAAEFRAKLLATLAGQKKLLRGTIDTIGVVVGKPFAKILAPAVELLVNSLNRLLKLFIALPASIKAGGALAFLAGSLALVVTGLGVAIAALVPLVGGSLVAAFTAAAPFILAVLGGLAQLALQVVLLKTLWDSNFGGIRDTAISVFSAIRDVVLSVAPILMGVFSALREGLGGVFSGIMESVGPVFAEMISTAKALFGAIMDLIAPVVEALGFEAPGATALKILKVIAGFVVTFLFNPLTKVVKVISFAIRFVLFQFRTLFKVIGFIARVFGPITSFLIRWNPILGPVLFVFRKIFEVVKFIGEKIPLLVSALRPVVFAILTQVTSMVNSIIRKINKVINQAARAALKIPGISRDDALSIRDLRLTEISFTEGGRSEGAGTTTSAPSSPAAGSESLTPATPTGGGGAPQAQGLSEAQFQQLVGAVIAAQENRPIMVEGRVDLSGEEIGEFRAAEEDEARARAGAFRR